jgi:predicted CopG family antitoxin
MATKTISIELDVYERLRHLKSGPGESFSQVLRRELPEPQYWTAVDFLQAIESGAWKGLGLSEKGLQIVEEADRMDAPPTGQLAVDDRRESR